MKQLFLVSDQRGVITVCSSFKEGKAKYDNMCSTHIKQFCDNPTYGYRKNVIDLEDGNKVYQFAAHYKGTYKGKPRFFNDLFSFQIVTVND